MARTSRPSKCGKYIPIIKLIRVHKKRFPKKIYDKYLFERTLFLLNLNTTTTDNNEEKIQPK